MRKRYFAVLLILCAIWLAGCGNHDLFANEPESTAVEAALPETATPEIALPETVPPEDALLREGRTAELVGISLGDDFDYDLFDGSNTYGYDHADPKYRGITYHFDGKGHRFSGFSVNASSENQKTTYFGIHFGKDRMDDMKERFGESDFYGEPEKPYFDKRVHERTAVWQFERATLTLWEVDRKICRLKYAAAESVADGQGESETELARDCREAHATVESIYQWTGKEESDRRFYTKEIVAYDDEKVAADEEELRELVAAWLEENGFGGRTPTGTVDIQDEWVRLDYYVDEQEQKYCFILWNYSDRDEKLTAANCAAKSLADAEYKGAVLCEQDKTGGVIREREYDEWGRKRAEVSYRYREGIVFPFITEGWNLDDGEFLCRNQMMTFSEAYSIFDDMGKMVETREISQDERESLFLPLVPYLPYNCTCIYGEDGRLETLKEELQEYDIEMEWGWWRDSVDYSGRIDFWYRADGTPRRADYLASDYTHGTYKSNGTIQYDEQGRMLSDSFYTTHGGDLYLYLYQGNEERPWARIDECSFVSSGFEAVTVFMPKDTGNTEVETVEYQSE